MIGNNMKNAILFGNGFNLLNGGISWNELLKKISTGTLLTGIPNTLQYETIVLSQEYYKHVAFVTSDGRRFITADGKEFHVRDKPIEEVIKEKIKEILRNFTSNCGFRRNVGQVVR